MLVRTVGLPGLEALGVTVLVRVITVDVTAGRQVTTGG